MSNPTKHRAMMFDLLTMKGVDVALKYDYTEGRLSVLRNSPLWKEEERLMLEEMQKSTRVKIIANNEKAVDTLVEVMDTGDSDAVKVSAAKNLLSIGGFPSGVVITQGTEDTSYQGVTETLAQIQEAKKAILEAAGMSEEELFGLEESSGES